MFKPPSLQDALQLTRSPLAIVLALLIALVSFAFYSTPFSSHVEEYLFDARTRLKPHHKVVPEIVLVTFSEGTLARLGGSTDGRIDVQALTQVAEVLEQSQARRVGVLFFPNLFDFDDPAALNFVDVVRRDRRFLLGTLAYHTEAPAGIDLPPLLSLVGAQTFGVDTLKRRSNSVVRVLPLTGFQGLERRPMLPLALVEGIGEPGPAGPAADRLLESSGGSPGDWYLLNFLESSSFETIDAADLLADPRAYRAAFAGKIVLVAPTVFREWMTQTREQVVTNTPIKGDPNTYQQGESIAYLTANAVENLLTGSWLRTAPPLLTALQTILVTTLFVVAWTWGVATAVLTIILGWLVLLVFHGLLFHYSGLFVPLADTALFSSIAILVGALVRLNVDVQGQARIQAEIDTKSALATSQSRYLERFAQALATANDAISEKIGAVAKSEPPRPVDRDLLARALSTTRDFSEYLVGIIQADAAEAAPLMRPALERVALRELFATVVGRFDAKLHEHSIAVVIDCDPALAVRSNGQLLDNIVFNLLSNAIKYSPDGGQVHLIATATRHGVIVEVTDQGPGIPPEFQERIFEKFYRVKDDTVYKVKGTGLGLYLCRYFAARIGATVRCASEPGKGSTFSIELGRPL